jgi:hypothetical protein
MKQISILWFIILISSCSERIVYNTYYDSLIDIKDVSYFTKDGEVADVYLEDVILEDLIDVSDYTEIENSDGMEDVWDLFTADIEEIDDIRIVRCPDGGCIGQDIYTCQMEVNGDESYTSDAGSTYNYVEKVWEKCGGFEVTGFYGEYSELTISRRYVILNYIDIYDDTNPYTIFSDVKLYDKEDSNLSGEMFNGILSIASCDSCDFCYMQNSYGFVHILSNDENRPWSDTGIGIDGRPIGCASPIAIDNTDEYVVFSCLYESGTERIKGRVITRFFKDFIIWQIYEPIKTLGPSGPVISSNGTIYLFDADDGLSLNAYTRDGEKLWRKNILKKIEGGSTYPVIDDRDNIYVITSGNTLISIDSDGNLRWQLSLSFSYLVIGEDGNIYALQHTSPYDSRIYVVDKEGRLLKRIDLKNILSISHLIALSGGRLLFMAYKEEKENTGLIEIVIMSGNGDIIDEIAIGRRVRIRFVHLSIDEDGSIYFLSPNINGDTQKGVCLYKYRVKGISLAHSPWPVWRADPKNTGRVQKW